MASRRNEVYAAVHPGIGDPFLPVDVYFLLQVDLILVVDELHDGLPAEKSIDSSGMRKTICCAGFYKQLLQPSD